MIVFFVRPESSKTFLNLFEIYQSVATRDSAFAPAAAGEEDPRLLVISSDFWSGTERIMLGR